MTNVVQLDMQETLNQTKYFGLQPPSHTDHSTK